MKEQLTKTIISGIRVNNNNRTGIYSNPFAFLEKGKRLNATIL